MFAQMVDKIRQETAMFLLNFKININRPEPPVKKAPQQLITNSTESATVKNKKSGTVGRNDPCPCGSGKKYKNCCGRNQ